MQKHAYLSLSDVPMTTSAVVDLYAAQGGVALPDEYQDKYYARYFQSWSDQEYEQLCL